MPRRAATVLLGSYLAVVAVLTLTSVERRITNALIAGFHHLFGASWQLSGWIVEPFANVALFVPLAFFLLSAFPARSARAVWLGCTLASSLVEVTQGLFLPDRTPSLLDVAANSTGAMLGVLLHRWLTYHIAS